MFRFLRLLQKTKLWQAKVIFWENKYLWKNILFVCLQGSVNDLKLEEKLLLLDLVRVQEKVSGAEMLTVIDKLYTYMKVSGRGITYERFYILALRSVGMIKDRPKSQIFPVLW